MQTPHSHAEDLNPWSQKCDVTVLTTAPPCCASMSNNRNVAESLNLLTDIVMWYLQSRGSRYCIESHLKPKRFVTLLNSTPPIQSTKGSKAAAGERQHHVQRRRGQL